VVGNERLRQLLVDQEITFQRTKTWQGVQRPARVAKLDRIEFVVEHQPTRVSAFDEGPVELSV
jgi:hypothetical protein